MEVDALENVETDCLLADDTLRDDADCLGSAENSTLKEEEKTETWH